MQKHGDTLMSAQQLKPVNNITTSPVLRLMEMAMKPDVDLERIKVVMDIQEKWERREAEKAFHKAMSEFKGLVHPIKKSKTVNYKPNGKPPVKYNHASLDDVEIAIKDALIKTGLSYRFVPTQSDGKLKVKCITSHELGYSEEVELYAPYDTSGGKDPIKAMGSTQYYLQRYTVIAAFGLSTTEDAEEENFYENEAGFKTTVTSRAGFTASSQKPQELVSLQRKLLLLIRDEDTQGVFDTWNNLELKTQESLWKADTKNGYFDQSEKDFIKRSLTKHK